MTKPLAEYLYKAHYTKLTLTRTPSDGSGYFEGLASTWDVDRDNERFAFGAWSESIDEWKTSGSMPPLFFSHQNGEPNDIIGHVMSMEETVDGLLISGQLDLTNTRAVDVYERMLAGVLDTMSVGFIGTGRYESDSGVTVIGRAELLEVSLTPVPANPNARVQLLKNTTTSGGNANVTLTYEPDLSDPAYWSRRIDELERSTRLPLDPAVVNAFVLETREIMAGERDDANAQAQRVAAQAAAEHQVITDHTSGEQFHWMLFPAAVRARRNEEVGVDV
jgi:HK97 family phage prohead protease